MPLGCLLGRAGLVHRGVRTFTEGFGLSRELARPDSETLHSRRGLQRLYFDVPAESPTVRGYAGILHEPGGSLGPRDPGSSFRFLLAHGSAGGGLAVAAARYGRHRRQVEASGTRPPPGTSGGLTRRLRLADGPSTLPEPLRMASPTAGAHRIWRSSSQRKSASRSPKAGWRGRVEAKR